MTLEYFACFVYLALVFSTKKLHDLIITHFRPENFAFSYWLILQHNLLGREISGYYILLKQFVKFLAFNFLAHLVKLSPLHQELLHNHEGMVFLLVLWLCKLAGVNFEIGECRQKLVAKLTDIGSLVLQQVNIVW
jgi:hypothetical protein